MANKNNTVGLSNGPVAKQRTTNYTVVQKSPSANYAYSTTRQETFVCSRPTSTQNRSMGGPPANIGFPNTYVNNSNNRNLGRVGLPHGCVPQSRRK